MNQAEEPSSGDEGSGTEIQLRCPADIPSAIGAVGAAMVRGGFSDDDVFGMRLAVQEAVTNALRHGHCDDPAKLVQMRIRVTPERAIVEVEDEGPGFDRCAVPDPCAPENRERPGGRGLLLMRAYVTWVRFNERGNTVTLCKERSGG